MKEVWIMVGLPGSGKTTWALTKFYNFLGRGANIICTDDIREEMYGDAAIQGDGNKVFTEAYNRIADSIKDSNIEVTVFDATNLKRRDRKKVLSHVRDCAKENGIRVTAVCVFVNTPLEVCLQRNANRSRNVPEEVIYRMHDNMRYPDMGEGFDEYIFAYNP